MAERLAPITVKDAKIRWLNFTGKEMRYNRAGDRNFTLFVEPESVDRFLDAGLNVKHKEPREGYEDQGGLDILKISVKYTEKARPPKVVLVSSRGQTALDEDDVKMLDIADIKKVDLVIQPGRWEANGNSGIAAYLKSIYVTINEDELDLMYADIPESFKGSIGETFEGDEDQGGVSFR